MKKQQYSWRKEENKKVKEKMVNEKREARKRRKIGVK
jgi:hypothetical protein